MSPTETLDATHEASVALTLAIRRQVAELRRQVATWEPRPYREEARRGR